ASRDRCTVLPHESLSEFVLSAERIPTTDRARATLRRRKARRSARTRSRRRGERRLVTGTRQRGRTGERATEGRRESTGDAGLCGGSVTAGFAIRPLRRDEIDTLLDQLEEIAEERRWIGSEPPIPRDRWQEEFERRWDDDYYALLASVDEEDRELGGLLWRFGLRRFVRLPRARREAVLLAWCESKYATKRAAFQALRKGALLAFCSHAENQRRIGYPGALGPPANGRAARI